MTKPVWSEGVMVEVLSGSEALKLGACSANVSAEFMPNEQDLVWTIKHQIACAAVNAEGDIKTAQIVLAEAFGKKRRVRLRYTFPAGDIYSYSGYVGEVEELPFATLLPERPQLTRVYHITQFGRGRLV